MIYKNSTNLSATRYLDAIYVLYSIRKRPNIVYPDQFWGVLSLVLSLIEVVCDAGNGELVMTDKGHKHQPMKRAPPLLMCGIYSQD